MDFYSSWLDKVAKAKRDLLQARKELTLMEQDLKILKDKQKEPAPNKLPLFDVPVINVAPDWSAQFKAILKDEIIVASGIPNVFMDYTRTGMMSDMPRIEQDPELKHHMADAMAYNFKLMQEEIEHKKHKAFVSELECKFQRPSTTAYNDSHKCSFGVSSLFKDPDKLALQKVFPHLLFSDKIPMYYGLKGENYIGLLRVSDMGQVHRIALDRHKIDVCTKNVDHDKIAMKHVFYADSQTIRDIMECVAKLKGFAGGKTINQGVLTCAMQDSIRKIPDLTKEAVVYDMVEDIVYVNNVKVYSNGIWAEVIEPTLEEIAEKANVSVSYLKNLLRDEE